MPIWLSVLGAGVTLAITAVEDIRHRKVSGAVIFPSIILAVGVAATYGSPALASSLVGLCVAAVVAVMVSVVLPLSRRGWFGTGDALLFLPIGAWCGWSIFLWGAVLGCVAMLPVGLLARQRHVKLVPFAPALLVGLLAAQVLALF